MVHAGGYVARRCMSIPAFVLIEDPLWTRSSHGPAARASVHDDANDDSVQADSGGEDDNDEHANESRTILGSDKSCAGAENTDADTAEDVRETHADSNPESAVASVLSKLVSVLILVDVVGLGHICGLLALRDKKGNDEAVDAASLAENDTDQVLRLDAGHLDQGTQD